MKTLAALQLDDASCSVIPFPFADYNSHISHLSRICNPSFDSPTDDRYFLIGCPGYNANKFLTRIRDSMQLCKSRNSINENILIVFFGGSRSPVVLNLLSNQILPSVQLPTEYHALMKMCNLVLLPPRLTHRYAYSFSATLADALAHEKPLVMQTNAITRFYENITGPFSIPFLDDEFDLSFLNHLDPSTLDTLKSNVLHLKSLLLSESDI
ncbi:MAG: hypothetical protein FJ333_09760 [Sphingomonadales bacterium]|nr:hypothetical protein [Sphingomonadales bacterium]